MATEFSQVSSHANQGCKEDACPGLGSPLLKHEAPCILTGSVVWEFEKFRFFPRMQRPSPVESMFVCVKPWLWVDFSRMVHYHAGWRFVWNLVYAYLDMYPVSAVMFENQSNREACASLRKASARLTGGQAPRKGKSCNKVQHRRLAQDNSKTTCGCQRSKCPETNANRMVYLQTVFIQWWMVFTKPQGHTSICCDKMCLHPTSTPR